jgi:hypothetical protein
MTGVGERKTYVRENELSGTDSVHVMQKKVYEGMPVEHALAALGPPNEADTTSTDTGVRVEYLYRARANAFDPGNVPRGYLYAMNGRVTDWEGLNRIPRLDAYYEGGL